MTDATDYVTYQIRYLGEVIDETDFLTAGEARAWRDKFCQDLMDGKFPNYLDAGDFEDYADCRDQHRVVRAHIMDQVAAEFDINKETDL